jgi:uracil-DNA glycosylase family 4
MAPLSAGFGSNSIVDGEQFQLLLQGKPVSAAFEQEYPFYPLSSPGMPFPGITFMTAAEEMGDPPVEFEGKTKADRRLTQCGPALSYLYRRALYDSRFSIRVALRATMRDAPMLPGHLLAQMLMYESGGPRQSRVMVVYKCPGQEDLASKAHLSSDAATVLTTALNKAGAEHIGGWYITPVVKWPIINPQSNTIPQSHKVDNAILLEQELRLVQPDFILCLGAEAVKAILGDKQTIRSMLGRVADKVINLTATGQQSRFKTARVMVAESPTAVAMLPEKMDDFMAAIANFVRLTRGVEVGQQETGLRHINVYKQRQLKAIVDEIKSDPDPWRRLIAIDGEWEGNYPTDDGAYLRTIQFSSKHKEGITVVLRHQGGAPAFKPNIAAAITELQRLLLPDDDAPDGSGWVPRIGGHFLRADLPWFIHAGLDVRSGYAPPDNLADMRSEGGFETILQCHAVDETALFGLTEQTVKLTDAPAYDIKVREAVTDRCKELDIKKEQLEGYGFLPQWVLHPEPTDPEWGYNYASLDPDVTRRICMRHMEPGGLLDKDMFGNSSWEPYFNSHRASLGVLEMEMNGISVDFARIDKLSMLFIDVHNRLLTHLRQEISWPMFNPSSVHHKVEFLFGERYSPKIDKVTGQRVSVRPAGAMTLNFTPLKTTGKRTMMWDKVVSKNEEAIYSPSTDKETLGILGYENKLVMLLRDIVFIAQTLKGVLREPQISKQGEYVRGEDGFYVYGKGLSNLASSDGKIRTRIRQTMETGRGSSSRPNLQAISSRREADYKRILGAWATDRETGERVAKGQYLSVLGQPCYAHPIRSILKASPGYALVEADYTGAELAAIAWLSGDQRMIEHVRRNVLPENHPDYYDIHSHQAVNAFHMTCPPTKKGLAEAGKSQLRVAAKNVNFGVPYGRGAEAISRQCQEEGVDASPEECQQIIDAYYEQYPLTRPFLDSCEERTQNPRWLAGSYGRYRRFSATRNRSVESDQRRQGKNFPIQNAVADAVWQAIYNFQDARKRPDCVPFRLLMQIHDALLFEVEVGHLSRFIKDDFDANGVIVRPSILRECMVDRVPVWPRSLDNRPMAVAAPYHFGIDLKVQLNWGESISDKEAEDAGIPVELIA